MGPFSGGPNCTIERGWLPKGCQVQKETSYDDICTADLGCRAKNMCWRHFPTGHYIFILPLAKLTRQTDELPSRAIPGCLTHFNSNAYVRTGRAQGAIAIFLRGLSTPPAGATLFRGLFTPDLGYRVRSAIIGLHEASRRCMPFYSNKINQKQRLSGTALMPRPGNEVPVTLFT